MRDAHYNSGEEMGTIAMTPTRKPQQDYERLLATINDARRDQQEKQRPSAYDRLSEPMMPQEETDRIMRSTQDKAAREKAMLSQNPSSTVLGDEIEQGKDPEQIRDAKRAMSKFNFNRMIEQVMRREPA